jgi:Ran GTPase-activating protein (RanGAP) involved in mRNA processing and transport
MSSAEARAEAAAALASATQARLPCAPELARVRAELSRLERSRPAGLTPSVAAAHGSAPPGGVGGSGDAAAPQLAHLRGAAAYAALTAHFAAALTVQLHDAAPNSRVRRRALRRATDALKQLAPLALCVSDAGEDASGGGVGASASAAPPPLRDRRALTALSAALQRVVAAAWAEKEDVSAATVALAYLARATGGASDALALACALAQAGERALWPSEAAAALQAAAVAHAPAASAAPAAPAEGAAARCCGVDAAAAAAAAATRLSFVAHDGAAPPDAALLPALAALVAAVARLAADGRCDARDTLRRLAPAMQPPGSTPPPSAKRGRSMLRALRRLRALRAQPSWPGATDAAAAACTVLELLPCASGAARCCMFAHAPPPVPERTDDDAAAASAQRMRAALSALLDSGELARQLAYSGAGVPALRWALADARAQLQQQQRRRTALPTPQPQPALSWGRHEHRGAAVSADGRTLLKTEEEEEEEEDDAPDYGAALSRAAPPPGGTWRVRCTNAVPDGDGDVSEQGGMAAGVDDPSTFSSYDLSPLFGWLCSGGSITYAAALRYTPPPAGPHADAEDCPEYSSGDVLGFAMPLARPGVLELTLNGEPAGSVAPLPPDMRLLPYACVDYVGQSWALEAVPARVAPPPAAAAVAAAVSEAIAAVAAVAAAEAVAPSVAPRPRLTARIASELFCHATAMVATVDDADRPAATRRLEDARGVLDAAISGATALTLALTTAVKGRAAEPLHNVAIFRAAAAAVREALTFCDAAALAAAQLREDAPQQHAVLLGAKLARAAAAAAVAAAQLTASVANAAACPCGDDMTPWLALRSVAPPGDLAVAAAWLERARAHPAATTPLAKALLRPESASAAVAADVALAAAVAATAASGDATAAEADAWLAALLVDAATAARAQPERAPAQLAAAAALLRDAGLSGSLPQVRRAALCQAPSPAPALLVSARAIALAADAAAAAAFERCAASVLRDTTAGADTASAIVASFTQAVRSAGMAALARAAPAAMQALLSHAAAAGARSPLASLSLDSSSGAVVTARCFADVHLGACAAGALAAQLHTSATLRELDLQCSDLGDAGAASLSRALLLQPPHGALAVLHIGSNLIGAAGATALAAALQVNTSLRELYAEDNLFGADGAAALGIALCHNKTLTALDVSGCRIAAAGAAAIAAALVENVALTELFMGGNAIGDEGAAALGRALARNTTLTALDASDNAINASGAEALGTASFLHSLDVSSNAIGADGAAALGRCLRADPSLTHLNVARNALGEGGATGLLKALQLNGTLTSLDVSGSAVADGICDAAAAVLADSLRVNVTLTALDISKNVISDAALVAVAEALRENRTLRTLDTHSGSESDASAVAFAATLCGNSTLTALRLGDLSRAGMEALAGALADNGSLATAPRYSARDYDGDDDPVRRRMWRADTRALVRAHCARARSNGISALRLDDVLIQGCDVDAERVLARAVCAALRVSSSVRTLSLRGNRLGDDVAVAVADLLSWEGCTLTTVDLSRNRIGSIGAAALAAALAHNTCLEKLSLRCNVIGNEGAHAFARGLAANSTLQVLQLQGCVIGAEAAEALEAAADAHDMLALTIELAPAEQPPNELALDFIASRVARNALDAQLARARADDPALTTLELGWSVVGDAGAAAVADALAANMHVHTLRLHKAAIADAGAAALAGMLRTNTTLTSLALARNSIGCAGAQALADALAENDTLTVLELPGNAIRDAGMRALCAARQRRAAPLTLRLYQHTPGDGDGGSLKRDVRAAGLLTDATCALLSSALVGAPDAARTPAAAFADVPPGAGAGCTAAAVVTAALAHATHAASLLRQVQHAARLDSAAAVVILTSLCDADADAASSFDVAGDELPALSAALATLVADGARDASAAAAALLALRLMRSAGAVPDQDTLRKLFVALSPERMLDADAHSAASCVDACALLPRREVASMLFTEGTAAALRMLAAALQDASAAPPAARTWLPLLAPLGGLFDASLAPDAATAVAAQLLLDGGGAEELLACAVAALRAADARANDASPAEDEQRCTLAAALTSRLLQCVSELCADDSFAARAADTPALAGLLLHASQGRPPGASEDALPALARTIAAAFPAAPRACAPLRAAEGACASEYAWRATLRVLHASAPPPDVSAAAFLRIALQRASDGDAAARALGAWRDALGTPAARAALALDLTACASAMLTGGEAAAAATADWLAVQLCHGWSLPSGVLSFVAARMTAAVAALDAAAASSSAQALQPQLLCASRLLLVAPSLPWGDPALASASTELLGAAMRALATTAPPASSADQAKPAAPALHHVALVSAAAAVAPPLDAAAAPPAPLRVPSEDAFACVRQLSELLRSFEARAPLPRWFVASLAPPPPASELQLAPGIYHCLPVAATAGMQCLLDAPYDAPLRLAALALPPGCAYTHVLVAGGDAASGMLQLAAVGHANAVFVRSHCFFPAPVAVRDGVGGAHWYCAPGHAFGFAPEARVELAPRRGDARAHDGEERLSWPLAADDAADDADAAAAVDPVAAEAVGGRCGHLQDLSELRAASFRRYIFAFTPGGAAGEAGCTPDEAAAWLAGASGDNEHWSADLDAQLVRLARSKAPSAQALADAQPGALFPCAATDDAAAAAVAAEEPAPEFGAAPSVRLPLATEDREPAPQPAERSEPLPLAQRSGASLAARFTVLQRFNAVAAACMHLLRPTDAALATTAASDAHAAADDDPFAAEPPPRTSAPLGARLLACKARLFPEGVEGALAAHLGRARGILSALPAVTLDMGSATLAVPKNNASLTLFEQLFAALGSPAALPPKDGAPPPLPGAAQAALWAQARPGERLWRAALGGLNASDAGGPFRDSLRAVAAELCRAPGEDGIARCPLRLFVRAPNADQQHAFFTDAFLPRPGRLDEPTETRLRFVGAIMGGCLVTGNPLELTLAPYVWKALLREERFTIHDLAAMDAAAARRLALLRAVSTPAEWPADDVTWAVRGAAGTQLLAAPGGLRRRVAFSERAQYVAAAVAARRRELAPALAALRSGLEAVVPPGALALLTWRALERRVAGAPSVPVAALRAATRSNVHPTHAQYEQWLWTILGAASEADRRAFLAFATGRSRLPPAGNAQQQHALVLSVNSGAAMDSYPRASTCSIAFYIAPASSLEAMRERLLYAIHNCPVIDGDGVRGGGRLFALADAGPLAAAASAEAEAAAAEGNDAGGDGSASAAATPMCAAARFVPLLAVALPEQGDGGSDDDGSDDEEDFCVRRRAAADAGVATDSEDEDDDDDGDDVDRHTAPPLKARARSGAPLASPRVRRAADPPGMHLRAQVESFAVPIYKVLQQVHPLLGITRNAMTVMCVFASLHAKKRAAHGAERNVHPLPQRLLHVRVLRAHRVGDGGARARAAARGHHRRGRRRRRVPVPAGRAGQARGLGGPQGGETFEAARGRRAAQRRRGGTLARTRETKNDTRDRWKAISVCNDTTPASTTPGCAHACAPCR